MLLFVVGPGAHVQEEDQMHADPEQRRGRSIRPGCRVPTTDWSGPRQTRAPTIASSEPRRIASEISLGFLVLDVPGERSGAQRLLRRRPSAGSHQIDHREHPDPDDIERVPEQAASNDSRRIPRRRNPLAATCATM